MSISLVCEPTYFFKDLHGKYVRMYRLFYGVFIVSILLLSPFAETHQQKLLV